MKDKLPLVMIPGLACTKELFDNQISVLGQDRNVIIPRHTGYDSFGAIVRAMLEELPKKFALAGLSMGGYLAFELLRQAPQRVVRLALLDTSARGDTLEKVDQRRAALKLAKSGRFDQVCHATLELSIANSRKYDTKLQQAIIAMAMEIGVQTWTAQMQALLGRPNSVALLPFINCPVLVLVGEEDQLTPVECALEMAEKIPGAKLKIVPDCGHMSTMERPDVVTRHLKNWLADD